MFFQLLIEASLLATGDDPFLDAINRSKSTFALLSKIAAGVLLIVGIAIVTQAKKLAKKPGGSVSNFILWSFRLFGVLCFCSGIALYVFSRME